MVRSNLFAARPFVFSRLASRRKKAAKHAPCRKHQQLQLEPLEERRVLAAAVTTDLSDYAPSDTAHVFASDFAIGEMIEFQVLHADGVPNTVGGHDPWQVTDGALRVRPNDPESQNELAWLLANRRDGVAREPRRALKILQSLVQAWPEEGHFWETQALAIHRLGSWNEALIPCEKATRLSRNHRGRTQLLLAIVLARLGEKEKARQALSQAELLNKAMITNVEYDDPSYKLDCEFFREEADSLLTEN
jgi:tetratricopeptide (TPR) repeat protein